MADKMAAAYQCPLRGHSNLVVVNLISSKLHTWMASIKVRKLAKVRNRYNQVPHLNQDTTLLTT